MQCLRTNTWLGAHTWVAGTFGSGHDPGVLGQSPARGGSLRLSLPLTQLSLDLINKLIKKKKKRNKYLWRE